MTSQRDVAISIGVGNAQGLDFLQAAINGARAFDSWAKALGYETTWTSPNGARSTLLIGENEPLTIVDVQRTFDGVLRPGKTKPIHRLIVYFAGHGLIRSAGETIWLLSDWYDQQYGVAQEVLKRRLAFYSISQITIVTDCCQVLPTKMPDADLTAHGTLKRGPLREAFPLIAIDKFIAAQDGYESYALPGNKPQDDKCIFSEVLMRGLWGADRSAYSTLLPTKVTSSSLGTYLQNQVPVIATKYQLKLNPQVSPTFPETDNVYFDDLLPPPSSPSFGPWPPPEGILKQSPGSGTQILLEGESKSPPDGLARCQIRSANNRR